MLHEEQKGYALFLIVLTRIDLSDEARNDTAAQH